jgi:hypothetical protein
MAVTDNDTQVLGNPRKVMKKSTANKNINEGVFDYSRIPEVPEILLTVADMKKDPIELLVELQRKYESYGAVKLMPPPEWQPPFCFAYGETDIKARIQHLHKLKYGKVRFLCDGLHHLRLQS